MKPLAWLVLAAGMLATLLHGQGLQLPSGQPYQYANTIRSGSGAPANSFGNDGDFYIDTTAVKLYGPKTAGAWGTGVSLQGTGGNGSGGNVTGANLGQGAILVGAGGSTIAASTFTLPQSGLVGWSDTGALTNKSIDASEINSGTIAPQRIITATANSIMSPSYTALGTDQYIDCNGTVNLPATPLADQTVGVINTGSAVCAVSVGNPNANQFVSNTNGTESGIDLPSGSSLLLHWDSANARWRYDQPPLLPLNYLSSPLANTGIALGGFGLTISTNGGPVRFAGGGNFTLSLQTIFQNGGADDGTANKVTDWQNSSGQDQTWVDGNGNLTISAQKANSGVVAAGFDTNGKLVQCSDCSSGGGGGSMVYPGAGVPVSTGTAWGTSFTSPSSALVGISDNQTLTNKSIAASEVNSGTLAAAQMPAFSGDITTSAGSTSTTLATVNTAIGTYGDATNTPQITVDGKGRITNITTVPTSGSGGGTQPWTIGTLAGLPSSCSAGNAYFATDQPAGQQLYECTTANTWLQMQALGGSGALAYIGGYLDIVTAVVPRLASANTFSGLNTFTLGMDVTEQSSCATPSSGNDCLYVNSTDHALHEVNSSGTDVRVGGPLTQTNRLGTYALNTAYQNTTGAAIEVTFSAGYNSAVDALNAYTGPSSGSVATTLLNGFTVQTAGDYRAMAFVVLPGYWYEVQDSASSNATIHSWTETTR